MSELEIEKTEYTNGVKAKVYLWAATRAVRNGLTDFKVSDAKENFMTINLSFIEEACKLLAVDGKITQPEGRARIVIYSVDMPQAMEAVPPIIEEPAPVVEPKKYTKRIVEEADENAENGSDHINKGPSERVVKPKRVPLGDREAVWLAPPSPIAAPVPLYIPSPVQIRLELGPKCPVSTGLFQSLCRILSEGFDCEGEVLPLEWMKTQSMQRIQCGDVDLDLFLKYMSDTNRVMVADGEIYSI